MITQAETIRPDAEANEPRKLVLDDAVVRVRVAQYPEPIREAVIWLAGYVRRCCKSDLKTLVAQCKDFNFTTTESTFSKLLRGYGYTSVTGIRLESPVINEETFLAIVRELERLELGQVTERGLAFVETGVYREIQKLIARCGVAGNVTRMGLIYGPTGRGKTHSCRRLVALNGHRTMFHMECPARPNAGEFMRTLVGMFTKRAKGATVELRLRALEHIEAKSVLILDNFQQMYSEKKGWDQPILADIRKLQEDTDCTVIFIVTYEFARRMMSAMLDGFLEQFAGRCGGTHKFYEVPAYISEADALLFGEAFKLADAKKHARELAEIGRRQGRDRVLIGALQDAQAIALAGGKPLTIEIVREALGAPSKDQVKERK